MLKKIVWGLMISLLLAAGAYSQNAPDIAGDWQGRSLQAQRNSELWSELTKRTRDGAVHSEASIRAPIGEWALRLSPSIFKIAISNSELPQRIFPTKAH